MRHIGILLWLLAGMVAYAPFAAADLEHAPLQPPTYSLTEQPPQEDRVYIPSWADPYGQMPDLGINDDPTPFSLRHRHRPLAVRHRRFLTRIPASRFAEVAAHGVLRAGPGAPFRDTR